MTKTSLSAAVLVLTLTSDALAQQPSQTSQPIRQLKWDIDGGIGWLSREDANWNTRSPADVQSGSGMAAYRLGLGHYWTTHWKTEASVTSVPREFGLFDVETISVAGSPQGADIFTNKRSTLTQLTLGGAYQFRENAFTHPFITAGVQVEWLRVHRFRAGMTDTVGAGASAVRFTVLALDERHVDTLAAPFIGGGAKFYVSRRTFIRPEYLMSFSGAISEWTGRLGFGVDF